MYQANPARYTGATYRRCGKSGVMLPAISLGLWHNFGAITPFETQRAILRRAFDLGITHFDLANNYGPPYGEAERNFARHMREDFRPYRDELIISTKAGYDMWEGPYGDHGSRKYLVASLDQSLQRMGLDYVDIFYHHRPDPDTPLEETMYALADIVRQGKALYVGLSNYGPEESRRAAQILREMHAPCLINQVNYSMLDRWIENGLTEALKDEGIGLIAFMPLQQGLLTGKYLRGIPSDSRISRDPRFLKPDNLTPEIETKIRALAKIAEERGQSLAQMALAWVLLRADSALIGASRPEQVEENVRSLENLAFSDEELARIEEILK